MYSVVNRFLPDLTYTMVRFSFLLLILHIYTMGKWAELTRQNWCLIRQKQNNRNPGWIMHSMHASRHTLSNDPYTSYQPMHLKDTISFFAISFPTHSLEVRCWVLVDRTSGMVLEEVHCVNAFGWDTNGHALRGMSRPTLVWFGLSSQSRHGCITTQCGHTRRVWGTATHTAYFQNDCGEEMTPVWMLCCRYHPDRPQTDARPSAVL